MIAAIRDNNPVLLFEHRWLYWQKGEVPEEEYEISIGKGSIVRKGKDITVVATSWMNVEALHAAEILARNGVEVEIVDPRTITPLDEQIIVDSVNRTGHCIVADNDWVFCGFSSEVAAVVSEKCFGSLKAPVRRIGFAHTPCPTARHLENEFYPNAKKIVRQVENVLGLREIDLSNEVFYSHEKRFKGPF
jgi:pyruvate dehydrogenase E1 component beta subunit